MYLWMPLRAVYVTNCHFFTNVMLEIHGGDVDGRHRRDRLPDLPAKWGGFAPTLASLVSTRMDWLAAGFGKSL